jgi:hypothetical protein
MDDSRIPQKIMEECSGGRCPMGKPRGRWEAVVWSYAVDLLQIRNWKAAARKTEGWRKEIGEAVAQNATLTEEGETVTVSERLFI